MSDPYYISKERFIAASADDIFNLLASPDMHSLIDGSGTVRAPQAGAAERLSLGARFGMGMNMVVDYKVVNTVCEFEEGRRIAWENADKNIWRYVLKVVDGGTLVTEEWDARKSPRRFFMRLMRFPVRNAAGIERTLTNLETHMTTSA